MKRSLSLTAVIALALSLMAGPAAASPLAGPHSHFLLIGAEVDFTTPSRGAPYTVLDYKKCVPLAGGKAQTHNRFHDKVHFGRANEALVGAGHIVVPFGCPL
jgi:hypothetical protein